MVPRPDTSSGLELAGSVSCECSSHNHLEVAPCLIVLSLGLYLTPLVHAKFLRSLYHGNVVPTFRVSGSHICLVIFGCRRHPPGCHAQCHPPEKNFVQSTPRRECTLRQVLTRNRSQKFKHKQCKSASMACWNDIANLRHIEAKLQDTKVP